MVAIQMWLLNGLSMILAYEGQSLVSWQLDKDMQLHNECHSVSYKRKKIHRKRQQFLIGFLKDSANYLRSDD